jgi:hypothetical protein
MNILFSTICFVNRNKPGAEIYASFTQRLIEDVINKTPYDIMVTTNEPDHYVDQQNKYKNRIIVRTELLENHRLTVGVFNQLLKFYAIKNIDKKYDWVLYLDCDAGLTGEWNCDDVKNQINEWQNQGYDMLGTRTNAILLNELKDHESKLIEHNKQISQGNLSHYNVGNLFSNKFIFYNVSTQNGPTEWFTAKLPSEHILLIQNNDKLNRMQEVFEQFCYKFETQGNPPITVDMEAFEIGVSSLLAGYNMGDFGNYGLYQVLKVVCNHNNWEKVKY